jgi:hypothetical protein
VKIPALIWGGAIGLAVAALLAPATGAALGELAIARAERDRLATAVKDGPRALLDDGLTAKAADRDAANAALIARIRQLAGRGAVLVEDATPIADPAGLARIKVRLSGSEDAVVALADSVERATPIARFASWRIEASGGAVRLQGEVVAPWR